MKSRIFSRIVCSAVLFLSVVLTLSPAYGAAADDVIGLNTSFGGDPATTRAFDWQTAAAGDNVLQYEPGAGAFNGADAVTVRADQTVFATDDGVRVVHKVSLSGLAPGTSYLYRVADGSGGYSGVCHFQTAAAVGDPFTFLVFTDTQATTQRQYSEYFANSLAAALRNFPGAAFVLHTGDIVDDGGSERTQWNYFFGAVQTALPNVAFEPVSGNHDGASGGTAHFLNHFALPATHYSFVYGGCLFLILDTNGDMPSQIAWLEDTVRDNSAVRWKIVALHKGPYGGMHADDADVAALRRQLPPVFDRCGVDLVLEGHDHAYMRSDFMFNGRAIANAGADGVYENPQGIPYIVTGACGPKTYPAKPEYWTGVTWAPPQARLNDPEEKLFDEISVTADYLEINALTTDMRRVDYLKIVKKMTPANGGVRASGKGYAFVM